MKQTSRMSRSRSVQGSRPSTRSAPSKGVRPRMALSAVVLPAPLGPMSPRMRPSSTRRSMPSRATVVPNDLRRPRASTQGMASALSFGFRRRVFGSAREELLRGQPEPPNGRVDPRPLLGQELLLFAPQQQAARADVDEHASPPPLLDELLVGQLLVALEDRERIDPVVGGDRPHRRQGIALVQHAVEDHRDDPVANLPVDRLAVVPLSIHAWVPDYSRLVVL